MPIYEFYCRDCHTLFNFLSKSVNTKKRPLCPRCKERKLERQVSAFAMPGRAGDMEGMDDLPIDEAKMGKAITALAGEAENISEDNPRQAVELMRKFSNITGMEFSDGMETALSRMEAGEDPEKIETEMGDSIDGEDPFILPGRKGENVREAKRRKLALYRDETLYEM